MESDQSLWKNVNLKLDHLSKYITDEKKWTKLRKQTVYILLVIALISTVQTTLVYSPQFLIGALYHGRGIGVPIVVNMDEQKSEKILKRLYGLYKLYHGDKPIKHDGKKPHLP